MQYLTAMRYSAFSIEDVEGIELLRWEDQQKIRKYVEGGGPGGPPTPTTKAVTTKECGIEVSQTSRATCKGCSQKIMKGEVGFYVSLVCFNFQKMFNHNI
jgi:hypothetical protein